MIEMDGPPQAWIEDKDGIKYIYTAYAVGHKGESPVEVMQAFAAWRQEYEDPNYILVWRARPKLTYDDNAILEIWLDGKIVLNPSPEPFWKMYCRCVKIPVGTQYPMGIKEEGASIPLMN